MKNLVKLFILSFYLLSGFGYGDDATQITPLQEMRNLVKNIVIDNGKFSEELCHNTEYFERLAAGQKPRVTIVACADSRVQTTNFDFHPVGDVFLIRNIGNQLETCLGSVDYGVLHLKTPVLLFLGHSKCGAVAVVTKGLDPLRKEDPAIFSELKDMQVTYKTPNPTEMQLAANIAENVHHQVSGACTRYKELIAQQKLWVIGAVYDFTPEGHGKLKFIQVNNQIDKATIDAFLADAQKYGDYCNDPGRAGDCKDCK